MGSDWQKVRRGPNAQSHDIRPLVSLRRSSFGFNAHFVRHAGLAEYRFATIYIKPHEYKVGFRFHNDQSDQDAYTLQKTRSLQVGRLFSKYPWLRAVANMDDERARRFEPYKNSDGLWEIQVCPAFEKHATEPKTIPSESTGIYRYLDGEEIVYIGRGAIRSRALSPERREWTYDTIEYSVVDSEEEQQRWERYWLDQYVTEHARLPLYNRISGKRTGV